MKKQPVTISSRMMNKWTVKDNADVVMVVRHFVERLEMEAKEDKIQIEYRILVDSDDKMLEESKMVINVNSLEMSMFLARTLGNLYFDIQNGSENTFFTCIQIEIIQK